MFEYTETQEMVAAMTRRWAEEHLKPATEELESGKILPYELMRRLGQDLGLFEMADAKFQKLEERSRQRTEEREKQGNSHSPKTPASPEKEEARRARKLRQRAEEEALGAVMSRELSRINPGFVLAFGASTMLAGGAIMARGTPAQKLRWARPILTGKKIGAWGMTEPEAGSDAFSGMRTLATPVENGFVLNGQKSFITNAPYADIMVIYAKLNESGATLPMERRPIHAFIVEKGTEGTTLGPPVTKMGMHSSPTGEIFLQDVFVEAHCLLGETLETESRQGAKDVFHNERTGLMPLCLGILDRCIEISVDYARERKTWGRPIAQYQLIQEKLARMFVVRQNVENLQFKVWWKRSRGKGMSAAEASACKLYSARVTTEAALEAVQILGGNGYMTEYEVERLMRDAKLLQIGGGADEIQILHIARAMLS